MGAEARSLCRIYRPALICRRLSAGSAPRSDDEARVKELEDEELGSDSVPAGPMDESRPDEKSIYERIAELAGEYDYDMYWERSYEHNLSEGSYRQSISLFHGDARAVGGERAAGG